MPSRDSNHAPEYTSEALQFQLTWSAQTSRDVTWHKCLLYSRTDCGCTFQLYRKAPPANTNNLRALHYFTVLCLLPDQFLLACKRKSAFFLPFRIFIHYLDTQIITSTLLRTMSPQQCLFRHSGRQISKNTRSSVSAQLCLSVSKRNFTSWRL